MSLIERIDAARERWNVLEHPFYKRWSCGELSRDELAEVALNGFRSAFLPWAERERLIAAAQADIEALATRGAA